MKKYNLISHFSIEFWKIKDGSLIFDELVELDIKIGDSPIVFPISNQTENNYIKHYNMTDGRFKVKKQHK